jgi:hypothetical protein
MDNINYLEEIKQIRKNSKSNIHYGSSISNSKQFDEVWDKENTMDKSIFHVTVPTRKFMENLNLDLMKLH